ncbi:unnamed protein product [Penicillium salamii]|uniref:Xylanolytic transcriptional activator regulatory domain-containing protein n=1 Tax=Penicillium salamii TaxID=1612424 RepID=A0A9W4J032_9EURO|nr:unnamed protein product [Penicillium salamii]CAG8363565.1 unnamed protein product [Penicillium salamii]CAG8365246.1 unnamed protein product [Penicillium salamii]CAG8385072.1 unnamed protein product [Penicillium salamii]
MHVDDVSGSDPALKNTLTHLNTLLQPLTSKEDYSFHSSLTPLMPNIRLLPAALVIGMLQRFKTRYPIFLSSYAVNDLKLVEGLCQSIYFPIKSISIGQIASMHGIFYCLLKEYEAMKDPLCQQFDFPAQIAQCEKNFIMALETYEIMSVPSFDNILGLTMGAIKAQGEAKPFLYSSLISTAATHCQTLGYHRDMTHQNLPAEKAENMRRLFWAVYVFDKNTSLLLGKASQIQDCEIDTRYPLVPLDPSLRPWDESFILGIKLANLQGRIYGDLYSAGASSKSSYDRADAINQLVASMEQWRVDLESIDSTGVNNQQVFTLSRGNWDIMYYSTLTSIFRAASPQGTGSEINADCFRAARLGLKSHLSCFPHVLLFSSFTPFIVTFLHAVASKSPDDIQILEDVVDTLKGVKEASRASRRLYKLCSTFAYLAKVLSQMSGSFVGIYNPRQDSLQLANGSSQPVFQPDLFQNALDVDFTDYLSPMGVSAVLDGWAKRQPLSMNVFDFNSISE